jgi:hypothetical protein
MVRRLIIHLRRNWWMTDDGNMLGTQTERAGNGSQPFSLQYNLEREVDAEFTPDRAWNEGGVGSEKASRVTQR